MCSPGLDGDHLLFVAGGTRGFCANGLFLTDLDKLDNEKKDLIQSDIAALHQFYSRHLEFPDHSSLVVLFAQVRVPALGRLRDFPSRAHGDTWKW